MNFDTGTSHPTLLTEDVLADLQSQVRSLFEAARGSHAWDHTLRVFRLCEKIGRVERADMDVVRVAALLHDIGRSRQDDTNGQVCHARKGAEMAAEMIRDLPLSVEQKRNILHCIRSHRFRGDQRPETDEAAVLFDADKIDAIGPVNPMADEEYRELETRHEFVTKQRQDLLDSIANTQSGEIVREFPTCDLRRLSDITSFSLGNLLSRCTRGNAWSA